MTEENYTITERPIEGDIVVNRRSSVEQGSAEEFLAALDTILDEPGVEAVKWTQYTPYFNDGDACEFGLNDPTVRLVGDDEEAGDYGDGFRSVYDFWEYPNDGSYDYSKRTYIEFEGVDVPALYEKLSNFNTARFEAVAQANFGDHAEVTATKAGFNVEYYEHD